MSSECAPAALAPTARSLRTAFSTLPRPIAPRASLALCWWGFAQNAASPNLRFLTYNWLEIQLRILLASDRGEAGSAGAGCFSTREAAWNLLDFVVYTVRGGGKFYLPQGRESAQRADQ